AAARRYRPVTGPAPARYRRPVSFAPDPGGAGLPEPDPRARQGWERMHTSRWMRWLVLGGMLALPAHANGQVGRVVGRVLGSGTSEPLASAQVFLEGTSVGALSGADGRYALGGVPAGLHDVRVQLIGYASRTVALAIVEGRTTILD